MDTSKIEVRPLLTRHVQGAVDLHLYQLSDEFITRFGKGFLIKYYEAFAQSPHGVALVAIEVETGRVVGTLLGSLRAAQHYRYVFRRFGMSLGLRILWSALTNPALARDILNTRLRRYVRGTMRLILKKFGARSLHRVETETVGDLTHLVVDLACRSQGVGSQLVRTYESLAFKANVNRIDLVTLPGNFGGAGDFYERLGYCCVGQHVSRSGETFLLYRKYAVKPVTQEAVQSLQ